MAVDSWSPRRASLEAVKKKHTKTTLFVSRQRDLNLGRVIDVSQRYSLFLRTLVLQTTFI